MRIRLPVTALALVGISTVIVLASGCVTGPAPGPEYDEAALVIPDGDVPQGISAWDVENRRVFVVRDGESLRAFLGYTTHLENESIWWCPTRDAFISPFHGESYDRSGRILIGPQSRALDALPIQRHDGNIVVAPRPVVTGAPADDPSALSDPPWTDYASCPDPLK